MSSLEIAMKSDLLKTRDTYIFFGGLGGQMASPWFEFQGVAKQLGNINKVFFRDCSKTWYHKVYKEVITELEDICDKVGFDNKIIFSGNSMGAYAAYWFGALYGADEIIMFSPQTCITHKKKVLTWGDTSFEEFIKNTRASKEALPQFFDLATLPTKADVHLYYSATNKADSLHSLNLKGESIHQHPLDIEGHNVVLNLLHQDKIIPILKGNHNE